MTVSPDDHFVWWFSAIAALSIFVSYVWIFVDAVRVIGHAWTGGRLADQLHDGKAPLAEGDRYVAGVVEVEEGQEFAVRVEIDQYGTQRRGSKGGYTHQWTEQKRRFFTRPFWLRHDSGERIRVEPGQKVHLVDDLDRMVHDEPTRRYRIAELSPGEWVIAEGKLARVRDPSQKAQGYRDAGPTMWVLRPERGVERLHLSAERLGTRHRRRVRRITLALVLGWLPCLAISGALCSSYLGRLALGEPEMATITGKRHYTTRGSKGGITHHYVVDYRLDSGVTAEEELDDSDWEEVTGGIRVPAIVVPGFPSFRSLGDHSEMHWGAWIFGLVFVLVGFLVVKIQMDAREWFETKVVDRGSGKLPAPKSSSKSSVRVLSREQPSSD